MMTLSRWLAATVCAVVLPAAAAAGDMVRPETDPCCRMLWSGLYFGGSIDYGVTTSTLSHDLIVFAPPYDGHDKSDVSSHGVTGTISAGFDREIHPGVLLGIFGDYTFGSLNGDVAVFDPVNGPSTATVKYDNAWGVGGRLGIVTSCCTAVFVNAGYTRIDVEFTNPTRGSIDRTLDGYFIGAGVEHLLRDNIVVSFDYRFSDYGKKTLFQDSGACGCNERIDLDSQIHSLRLGLKYRFNWNRAEDEPLK